MDAELKIRQLIGDVYVSLGGEPRELVAVIPKNGKTWGEALSYEVVRSDGARTRVSRSAIEDDRREAIRASLQRFA